MYQDYPQAAQASVKSNPYAAEQAQKAMYEAMQKNQSTPRDKSEVEEQLSLLMSMADQSEKIVCVLRERLEPVLNIPLPKDCNGTPQAPETSLSPVATQIRNIRYQLERVCANASNLIESLAV